MDMEISDDMLRRLSAARILKANTNRNNQIKNPPNNPSGYPLLNAPTTHLSFHLPSGHVFVATTPDHLQVISALHGKLLTTIPSKKYGCTLGTFTHHTSTLLHASTRIDHAVRYVSVHDNTYLRYFHGHTHSVTGLEMHPTDDVFMTSSRQEGSVRIWDIRVKEREGAVMQLLADPPHRPDAIGWDPLGLVFGVTSHHQVRLFDWRNPQLGPFMTFSPEESMCPGPHHGWTGAKFSPDGKYVLLIDSTGAHLVVDALTGMEKKSMRVPLAYPKPIVAGDTVGAGGTCCWTPDSRYIVGTGMAEDDAKTGTVYIWPIDRLPGDHAMVAEWAGMHDVDPHHPALLTQIAWSPTLAVMVTAAQDVILWQPLYE